MNKNLRKLKINSVIQIIVLFFIIFLDQISKYFITVIFPEPNPSEDIVVIDGILEFTYIRNSGASFGIFQNRMILFYVITIAVLIIVAFFWISVYRNLSGYYKFCETNPSLYKSRTDNGMIFANYILAALAGGATGNFIDRIRLGYVVDFIDLLILKTPSFKGGFHWESFPIFNIADIFVTFSAVLLLIFIIFIYKEDENFSLFRKK